MLEENKIREMPGRYQADDARTVMDRKETIGFFPERLSLSPQAATFIGRKGIFIYFPYFPKCRGIGRGYPPEFHKSTCGQEFIRLFVDNGFPEWIK
jgi:hypothetical protein